jgi:hypothetical protein
VYEERFFRTVHTGAGAHPASYTMRIGSLFQGLKRPGLYVNHLPPYSAGVKEIVDVYLCYPSGTSWPVLGRTVPFFLYCYVCGLGQSSQPVHFVRNKRVRVDLPRVVVCFSLLHRLGAILIL